MSPGLYLVMGLMTTASPNIPAFSLGISSVPVLMPIPISLAFTSACDSMIASILAPSALPSCFLACRITPRVGTGAPAFNKGSSGNCASSARL